MDASAFADPRLFKSLQTISLRADRKVRSYLEDYAKRDHYREPPIPGNVKAIANTLAFEQADDQSLIDVDGTTVYRWVQKAATKLEGQTDDEGWAYLDVRNLRRTWGTSLLEQGVLPSVVMAWGDWRDWDTFRDHYLGECSPEAIKRERSKVDFLSGGDHGTVPENRLSTLPPIKSDARTN